MSEEKVIMYNDPALVEPVKVDAFKGADGQVYFTEDLARWNNCTHIKCDNCGGAARRGWLLCDKCREAHQIDAYSLYETKEWDCETPLYSELEDKYFFNKDELLERLLGDSEITLEKLRLVFCKPIHLSQIETDHWEDELPHLYYGGDGSLPDDIQQALDKLNETIRNHKEPVAWESSKVAATFNGE